MRRSAPCQVRFRRPAVVQGQFQFGHARPGVRVLQPTFGPCRLLQHLPRQLPATALDENITRKFTRCSHHLGLVDERERQSLGEVPHRLPRENHVVDPLFSGNSPLAEEFIGHHVRAAATASLARRSALSRHRQRQPQFNQRDRDRRLHSHHYGCRIKQPCHSRDIAIMRPMKESTISRPEMSIRTPLASFFSIATVRSSCSRRQADHACRPGWSPAGSRPSSVSGCAP